MNENEVAKDDERAWTGVLREVFSIVVTMFWKTFAKSFRLKTDSRYSKFLYEPQYTYISNYQMW